MSQYKLAADRPQGTANIRVFTPTVAEHGWSAGGHTRRRGGHRRHAVPRRLRDDGAERGEPRRAHGRAPADPGAPRHHRRAPGDLHRATTSSSTGRTCPHDISRESWMHIEIGRESSPSAREDVEQALGKVLLDVREAVEDWPKMHSQALEHHRRPRGSTRRRCRPRRSPRGRRCCAGSPTSTSRSSATASTASRRCPTRATRRRRTDFALRAVPGTGLRHPALRPGHVRVVRQAAAAGRAKAREKTLLVLAKANSKATVHRPVYLDYVGVKTFDETARSSASGGSSGCSRPPPTPSR